MRQGRSGCLGKRNNVWFTGSENEVANRRRLMQRQLRADGPPIMPLRFCLPSKGGSILFRFRKLLKPNRREFLNCVPLPLRRGCVLGRSGSMNRARPTLFPLCFPQKKLLRHIFYIRYSLRRRDRKGSSSRKIMQSLEFYFPFWNTRNSLHFNNACQ
jgi:hypothetical protein